MSKIKLLLDVVEDARAVADSLIPVIEKFKKGTVKGSQFCKPLLEFSGALPFKISSRLRPSVIISSESMLER